MEGVYLRVPVRFQRLLCVATLLLPVSCQKPELPDLDAPACDPDGQFGPNEGDLAQNFRLTNQRGEDTYLSDFCGQVVIVQMGAMWCTSCQMEARRIPELMEEFGEEGLLVVSLMAETIDGASPTRRDLESWDLTFDLNTPVLADPSWGVFSRYFPRGVTPGTLLLDRDGRIVRKDFVIFSDQIADLL